MARPKSSYALTGAQRQAVWRDAHPDRPKARSKREKHAAHMAQMRRRIIETFVNSAESVIALAAIETSLAAQHYASYRATKGDMSFFMEFADLEKRVEDAAKSDKSDRFPEGLWFGEDNVEWFEWEVER